MEASFVPEIIDRPSVNTVNSYLSIFNRNKKLLKDTSPTFSNRPASFFKSSFDPLGCKICTAFLPHKEVIIEYVFFDKNS